MLSALALALSRMADPRLVPIWLKSLAATLRGGTGGANVGLLKIELNKRGWTQGYVAQQLRDQADQAGDIECREQHRIVAAQCAFQGEQPQPVQREDGLDQQRTGEDLVDSCLAGNLSGTLDGGSGNRSLILADFADVHFLGVGTPQKKGEYGADLRHVNAVWDQALHNRVANPARDCRIVIMQRQHKEDLAGHLLARGDFAHLCLPSEYNPKRSRVLVTRTGRELQTDHRTESGDVLFPQLQPSTYLQSERVRLGSRAYAAQHLQEPSVEGGGLFRRAWLTGLSYPWSVMH